MVRIEHNLQKAMNLLFRRKPSKKEMRFFNYEYYIKVEGKQSQQIYSPSAPRVVICIFTGTDKGIAD